MDDQNNSQKPIRILTDDVDEKPILDFDKYSEIIANMIRGSDPQFSIGIYGEWGTGKTTLMKLIEKKIEASEILTVWFNAWRYEREDQFALVALLKSIAFAMAKHDYYKEVAPIMFKGLRIAGKDVLRQIGSLFLSDKGVKEMEETLLQKWELLTQTDAETVYFDGLNKIEDAIKTITTKYQEMKKGRIVVFIDDLDRCSPKKALEVLESIKVFLDIYGFVFVLGLSHDTISKLIDMEYEKSGIRGSHYLRKIIQIPITVPEWNYSDIEKLLETLAKRLDEKYSKLIIQNKDVIKLALEANPREAKRFINSLIIARELFAISSSTQAKQILVVHCFRWRWSEYYKAFSIDEDFRHDMLQLASINPKERNNAIFAIHQEGNDRGKRLSEIPSDLWNFLSQTAGMLSEIKDFEPYRRALDSVKDISLSGISELSKERQIHRLRESMRYYQNKIRELEIMQERAINPDEAQELHEQTREAERNLNRLRKAWEDLLNLTNHRD